MTDILEGDESGEYTVTVNGPMKDTTWTWTGYADDSVDALSNAMDRRADCFEWDGTQFRLKEGNSNAL